MPTYGTSGAPAQDTINLDSLLSLSLFNYNKTLVDQIMSSNAFWNEMKPKWKGKKGGVALKQNLRYAVSSPTTYSGYDEVRILPSDNITQSTWDWRQAADSVTISKEEEVKNVDGLDDLLQSKIESVQDGFTDFFNAKQLRGNLDNDSGSTLKTPYTDTSNGSTFIDPLLKLIQYDPTASESIGGINQSTYTWWRNRTMEMSATTAVNFLMEMDRMHNTTSIGNGGKAANLILVDQTTFELWRSAYYRQYRATADSDNNYPFPNIKFNNARVVWDEKVPDAYSGTLATTTYGSAIFVNTEFLNGYYINDQNFVSTPFVRPHNQNAKTSLVLWMGTIAMSNRRKHGVVGKIPRTLS
jgi:hypothetical protein